MHASLADASQNHREPDVYDVVVIGGGPAGSAAAAELARRGRSVLIVEKTPFPRFHIGESLLPRNIELLRSMGLHDRLKDLPHLHKVGAEFVFGDNPDDAISFRFTQGLVSCAGEAANVERAAFDKMVQDFAVECGAELRTGDGVTELAHHEDGRVRVIVDGQPIDARWLIDASGQGAFVGRKLGLHRPFGAPLFERVAYFGHCLGVERLPGEDEGHPTIVMCDEGWFWMIAIDKERLSLGVVLDRRVAQRQQAPASQMLKWAIARCPVVAQRCRNATLPVRNHVIADFSYHCRPYHAPGCFLVGDAATFLDPIFSTGVCLGMLSGQYAAEQIDGILDGRVSPARAKQRHERAIRRGTGIFFRIIKSYYHHSFRELFANGVGPLRMHQAVISVLAGHVFPRMPWRLWWRMEAFMACVRLQGHFTLVPRRQRFSLEASEPDPAVDKLPVYPLPQPPPGSEVKTGVQADQLMSALPEAEETAAPTAV